MPAMPSQAPQGGEGARGTNRCPVLYGSHSEHASAAPCERVAETPWGAGGVRVERQRRPCRLLYGQPLVPHECPYVRASGPSSRVRVTREGRGGRTGRRVRRHAHREVGRWESDPETRSRAGAPREACSAAGLGWYLLMPTHPAANARPDRSSGRAMAASPGVSREEIAPQPTWECG